MRYREIRKILHNAGWYEVRQSGSHHQYSRTGIGYVVPVPEHGGRDIAIDVIQNIRKGTGLSLRR